MGRIAKRQLRVGNFDRYSRASGSSTQSCLLPLLAIGFASAFLAILSPSVTDAGIICASGSQGDESDEVSIVISQDLFRCLGQPPSVDAPQSPVPDDPKKSPHDAPQADISGDGTTSAPIPTGSPAAQAALATANLRFSLCGDSRWIRLFTNRVFDSPFSDKLLDPPRHMS